MKCGHGFGDHSQDGELARWGLGRDTKWRSRYAQKRLRNAKQGNHLKVISEMLQCAGMAFLCYLPDRMAKTCYFKYMLGMPFYGYAEKERMNKHSILYN